MRNVVRVRARQNVGSSRQVTKAFYVTIASIWQTEKWNLAFLITMRIIAHSTIGESKVFGSTEIWEYEI